LSFVASKYWGRTILLDCVCQCTLQTDYIKNPDAEKFYRKTTDPGGGFNHSSAQDWNVFTIHRSRQKSEVRLGILCHQHLQRPAVHCRLIGHDLIAALCLGGI